MRASLKRCNMYSSKIVKAKDLIMTEWSRYERLVYDKILRISNKNTKVQNTWRKFH